MVLPGIGPTCALSRAPQRHDRTRPQARRLHSVSWLVGFATLVSGCSRHLLAMMACVQLDESRVVCNRYLAERCARDYSPSLRAGAACVIEPCERTFEPDACIGRRRRPTGGIHCAVGPRFRKGASFQDSVKEKASRHRTQKNRQIRKLRRRSAHDVRRFVQRTRDVLHDLTRRPFSRRSGCGPHSSRSFRSTDEIADRVAIGGQREIHISHDRLPYQRPDPSTRASSHETPPRGHGARHARAPRG